MSIGTIKTAAWHGVPIKARVVVGVVANTPEKDEEHYQKHSQGQKRYLWYVPFIGHERQMVECVTEGETFYLDNTNGTGLKKVLNGGWPNDSHYSIHLNEIVREVPEAEWIHYHPALAAAMDVEIHEEWMKIDPEGYPEHKKRMDSLLASLRSFQKMNPLEQAKHIRDNMMKPANPNKKFNPKGKKDGKGKR